MTSLSCSKFKLLLIWILSIWQAIASWWYPGKGLHCAAFDQVQAERQNKLLRSSSYAGTWNTPTLLFCQSIYDVTSPAVVKSWEQTIAYRIWRRSRKAGQNTDRGWFKQRGMLSTTIASSTARLLKMQQIAIVALCHDIILLMCVVAMLLSLVEPNAMHEQVILAKRRTYRLSQDTDVWRGLPSLDDENPIQQIPSTKSWTKSSDTIYHVSCIGTRGMKCNSILPEWAQKSCVQFLPKDSDSTSSLKAEPDCQCEIDRNAHWPCYPHVTQN